MDKITHLGRSALEPTYTKGKMHMLRPTDRELAGGGSLGCAGPDIWATMCAAVTGDNGGLSALLTRVPRLATAEYWYTPPLHYAVREGHLQTVKLLLAAGADPTHVRYGGEDLQTVALDRGHEAVADVIGQAQRERLGGVMQDHALHAAVSAGELAAVEAMIRADPSLVNLPDASGRQPLHLAAQTADLNTIQFLLDHGADMEARTGSNNTYLPAEFTPIDFALWGSDWWIWPKMEKAAIDLLLDHGADYSIAIAAALGDRGRVEAILAQSPDQANSPRPCGRRALSAAAQFGHEEIVKLLLEAGANPNLPEGRYVSRGCALFFAARTHRADLVDLLLASDADPNQGIDSCGMVYHVADEVTRIKLYQHGLRRDDVDVENVEALAVWASKAPEELAMLGCGTVFTMVTKNEWFEDKQESFTNEKKEAVLRMLLAMGVKVPPVVTGCRSYLWHKPKLTRILLENGMDPDLPNWQWQTPLHDICSVNAKGQPNENRLELARLFLEFGAQINARDEEYHSTPLAWAARHGLSDMVQFLLEQGAAASVPDDEPWATPLAWATRRGHQDIVDLLKTASQG